MFPRVSGVLLPIPCLPSRFGIGDLGPDAYRFADYLHSAGQRVWQILPLNPTTPAYQYSPYHGASAFACNPLLVSPEHLAAEGLLDHDDIPSPELPEDRIDYAAVARVKQRLLDKACARFKQRMPGEDYARFCAENAAWLDDYALFAALSARYPDVIVEPVAARRSAAATRSPHTASSGARRPSRGFENRPVFLFRGSGSG